MNEALFAAVSCIQFIFFIIALLGIAYKEKLIEFEQRIRFAVGKVKRDGKWVVRVVKDFYKEGQ